MITSNKNTKTEHIYPSHIPTSPIKLKISVLTPPNYRLKEK